MKTFPTWTPPESALLCLCARTQWLPAHTEAIRALLVKPLDWPRLLEVGDLLNVLPLLAHSLHSVGNEGVPESVRETLGSHAQRVVQNNLRLSVELRNVLRIFEAAGLQAVPYKGPALAADVYENLALREFGDLDILLAKTDIPRAVTLLRQEGYRLRGQDTVAHEQNALEFAHHLSLFHESRQVLVELHWQFASSVRHAALSPESLGMRTGSTYLLGEPLPVFLRADQLLPLCEHGARHGWERLSWVGDIAEILHWEPGIDWEALFRQAKQFRLRRILSLGLWLAHTLLEAPLPESICRRIEADREVRALGQLVWERLNTLRTMPLCRAERIRFYARCGEGVADRARFLLQLLTTPTEAEAERFAAAPRFAVLPRVYRVLRLTTRHLIPRRGAQEDS